MTSNRNTIQMGLQRVKNHFDSGLSKDIDYRLEQLQSLKNTIKTYENEIYEALYTDLNKSAQETFMTELSIVNEELEYMISNLKKLAKPKRIIPSLSQLPGSLKILREPYGSVLIFSTWNYPLQLALVPLIGAIAAGNVVVLKPSEYSPQTSKVLIKICESAFAKDLVFVVEGGREENTILLENKFDYIFFTGSTTMGKVVMKSAAEHLTPLTLELGGKSPCIVDSNTNLRETAKRIVFGKLINAGQTCVAPDYIYVKEEIKTALIDELLMVLAQAIPNERYFEETFGKIISEKHYSRLKSLLEDQKPITVLSESPYYDSELKIKPVLLDSPDPESDVMKEEIFGPILPIISWNDKNELIANLKSKPKPLSMYIFSNDNSFTEEIIRNVDSGGVCINDTLLHMSSLKSPFGGVGPSGMGSYHGKWSFNTFSRERTVLKKWWIFDIPMRHQPYTDGAFKIIKKLLR